MAAVPLEHEAPCLRQATPALRIAAGSGYFSHGSQKLLGWFGGFGPDGAPAELMSRFGAAGIIETVAGALILLGLFIRPAAFIASGEMAVTYFWMHWGRSGEMWWWNNHGEIVLVYAFLWLFFSVWGAGPLSVDAWRARRRARHGPAPTSSSPPEPPEVAGEAPSHPRG